MKTRRITWISNSVALLLALVAAPVVHADVPLLSNFPNITIAYGSTSKIVLTPPQSSSVGAWTYSSSNTQVAVVNGDSLIPVSVGTSQITATQAAAGTYSSALIKATLTITQGVPSVGTFQDITATISGTTLPKLKITPPLSNSTGAWTFSSLNPNVATVSGTTISVLTVGDAVIEAVQAATANYAASQKLRATLSVTGPAPQLGAWQAQTFKLKDSPISLTPPTSPSSGTWSFSVGTSTIARVEGSLLYFLKPGVVTVVASQTRSANSLYGSATAQAKYTIVKNTPTVGTFGPLYANAGDPTTDITPPTSDSTGTWYFSTSDSKTAKVKNNIVLPLVEGTVTVTATQAATDTFDGSAPVSTTMTIGPALTYPTIAKFDDRAAYVGLPGSSFTIPKSTSPGQWSFVSSDPTIVSLTGATPTYHKNGRVTITATQAASGQFGRTIKTFQINVVDRFTITASAKNKVITVASSDPTARVSINNMNASLGKNTVKAGNQLVQVFIQGALAYSKKFVIKK